GGDSLRGLGFALSAYLMWGFLPLYMKALAAVPTLEVLVLTPAALGWIAWSHATGQAAFPTGARDTALLLGTGIVTAVPLIVYANGAKLLRLSTTGMLQYLVPTMVLVIAVFLFDEPFGRAQALAFAPIWAGMAAYVLALVRISRAG
ncbi:MAG: EamA family transporter, partial [Rhodobacterales bacterium]|nr:EamA family transporter [Rhodobacterales bacterium]